MKLCVLNDPTWEEPFDPSVYLEKYYFEMHNVYYGMASKNIKQIYNNFDIIVNFCDGPKGEKRPGIDVVFALESLKAPFTGAYSFSYEPSRNNVQRICHKKNIPTPKALVVFKIEDLNEKKVSEMKFPLIVKHFNSFGSIGLTKDSKVNNYQELLKQTELMFEIAKGVRIEEFIEGKEFSCLISQNPNSLEDPIAYDPIEFDFPEGESFKHQDLKWVDHKRTKCKKVESKTNQEKIKNYSKELFKAINGRGYARCDLRMNDKEEIYMLEINSQAGILYPPDDPGTADLILQMDKKGHDFFIDSLIKSAIVNVGLKNKII